MSKIIWNEIDNTQKYLNGRCSVLNHKGKNILIFDMSNFNNEQIEDQNIFFNEAKDWLYNIDALPNSILMLVDPQNSKATSESSQIIKDIMNNFCKPLVKKMAIISTNKMQSIFINTYKRISGNEIETFNTKDEALEWLVS